MNFIQISVNFVARIFVHHRPTLVNSVVDTLLDASYQPPLGSWFVEPRLLDIPDTVICLMCGAIFVAFPFQQMEKLKADNAKLKEENRALTRVVSKLSK